MDLSSSFSALKSLGSTTNPLTFPTIPLLLMMTTFHFVLLLTQAATHISACVADISWRLSHYLRSDLDKIVLCLFPTKSSPLPDLSITADSGIMAYAWVPSISLWSWTTHCHPRRALQLQPDPVGRRYAASSRNRLTLTGDPALLFAQVSLLPAWTLLNLNAKKASSVLLVSLGLFEIIWIHLKPTFLIACIEINQ